MMGEKKDNMLFKDEIDNIRKFEKVIKSTDIPYVELHANYTDLVKSYKKLLQLSKKIFKIGDITAEQIKRKENELKALLDNSNQGFLTIDSDLKIGREHSKECIKIFGRKIANINIIELLLESSEDFKIEYGAYFKAAFASENRNIDGFAILDKLPKVLKVKDEIINIEYKIIRQNWQEEEILLMLILTNVTEKKKAEEQIRYLTYHDKLTSLYNRTYIEETVKMFEGSRENLPFSVIVGDIDGLKLINDLFGHEEGDKLITTIANILKSSLRNDDFIGRWGGDEFIVLLPNTDKAAAKKLCQRIKANCRNQQYYPLVLSISLGYATQEREISFTKLFNTADIMMYGNKAKEGKVGRKELLLSLPKAINKQSSKYYAHLNNVYSLASLFCRELELADKSINTESIYLLAILNTLGMLTTSEDLVKGKENLSIHGLGKDDLFTVIEVGNKLLQYVGDSNLACIYMAIYENWDGTGLQGLKGEQIPLLSKVFSLVDYYFFLCEELSATENLHDQVLAAVKSQKSIKFDPYIVDKFVELGDKLHSFS